jgi:hypothetical protein
MGASDRLFATAGADNRLSPAMKSAPRASNERDISVLLLRRRLSTDV